MTAGLKKRLKILFYVLGGALSVSLLSFLIYNSSDSFVKIWSEVKPKYLIMSAFSALMIYTFMGMALWEVLRVMGRRINPLASIGIALVSTTVNYLVSSFGVSGFALRAHMLDRRKVPFGLSVTASIVITVLLYLIMLLIIFIGSVLLIFTSNATQWQILQSLALICAITLICWFIVLFLFHTEIRVKWVRKIFRLINRIGYTLFSLLIPKSVFDNFNAQLELGIHAIRKKRKALPVAIAYIAADWLFSLLVLYFAFRALGVFISPIALVSGFAVGMITTLIPILPGGLGALELGMTAVFSQFGVDWDSALSACLIYRALYYVAPGILSIPVYWILQFTAPSRKYNDRENKKSHA